MRTIVIGATGATGKEITALLLAKKEVETVTIFVRKDPKIEHEKLITHIVDFSKPETWTHLVLGDVLFSALGTTLKDAGSKEKQWQIDYDYQYQFAKVAKDNGINSYLLVSASNANVNSKFFYSKMKGKLDEAVQKLYFKQCIIFRPPILIRENSIRASENIAVKLLQFLSSIGILKSQKPLSTKHLAQSMVNVYESNMQGNTIIEGQDIRKYI